MAVSETCDDFAGNTGDGTFENELAPAQVMYAKQKNAFITAEPFAQCMNKA
jgi:hypothetical protein